MKKVYLSLLLVGMAGTSMAQMTEKPHSFGELQFDAKGSIQAPAMSSDEAKALGVTIWTNNFDTPAEWVIDNSGQAGGAFGWTIDATSDGWYDPNGISSTSGGNYAEVSNGDASQGTQALDVIYTLTLATPLDIPNLPGNTANTDQVTLQYEQYGALFNDAQVTQISVDGGTNWIDIRDNRDYHSVLSASGGSAYPNPETVSINLAPYITGNASNVSLRFEWTTNYPTLSTNPNVWITYGWYIDDIKIVTNPDNDLEAQMPYWGSVGLHYFQIPVDQVAPIDFTTNAFNNGIATQNNATLDVDVNTGAWTGSSAAGVNIAAGTYDSLVCTTQYTPAAVVGSHTVVWGVSQDETDDIPGNNMNADINFDVTDCIYARDNGVTDGSTYNQGNGYEAGNLFDVFNATIISAIDVRISSSSVAGASLYCKLYSIDPTTGDFILEDQTDYYTIQNGDLGSTITMPLLSGGFSLTGGETYLVTAGSDGDGGATNDFVVATAGDSDPQTSFYYDATDLTWYYTTSTPVVRMNFCTGGLNEGSIINKVNLYPNPVADELNINYELNNGSDVTIVVTDITGKVVAEVSNADQAAGQQTVNINTTGFANGMYTVSINTEAGNITRKFVKK